MFTPGSVSLLREVYGWTLSDMNIHDLNEQKYTLCRKLSEVTITPNFYFPLLTNGNSWPIALDYSLSKSHSVSRKEAISLASSDFSSTSFAIPVSWCPFPSSTVGASSCGPELSAIPVSSLR